MEFFLCPQLNNINRSSLASHICTCDGSIVLFMESRRHRDTERHRVLRASGVQKTRGSTGAGFIFSFLFYKNGTPSEWESALSILLSCSRLFDPYGAGLETVGVAFLPGCGSYEALSRLLPLSITKGSFRCKQHNPILFSKGCS